MGIIDGILMGYMAANQELKSEAYAHLQSMSDQMGIMKRVRDNTPSCSLCRYGTSSASCEYNALVSLYNDTLDDYAKRGLVKVR